jgi:hypothetical protein
MKSYGYFGTKPLEAFLPALADVESVQAALHKEFGERSVGIVNILKSGSPLPDSELSAYDIISDIVSNNGTPEWSINGLGNAGAFSIIVVQFGPIYWIEAGEADPLGYFETLEQARDAAEMNYEPFITALAEQEGDNE